MNQETMQDGDGADKYTGTISPDWVPSVPKLLITGKKSKP